MTEQQQQVAGGAINPTITSIPELDITAPHYFITNNKEEAAISALDHTTLALAYGAVEFAKKGSTDEIKPGVAGTLPDTSSAVLGGDGILADSFMRDAHAFCACKTILSVQRDQNQDSNGEIGTRTI